MLRNLLQKYRSVLITVIATLSLTALTVSGYSILKDRDGSIQEQQADSTKKSIKELQYKSENLAENEEADEIETEQIKEVGSEDEKSINEKTYSNVTQTEEKLEIIPTKTEEKKVSCVAFDGTTLRVSEGECDVIKQKNVIAEKTLDKYDECISEAEDDLAEAKEEYQNSMKEGYDPYIISKYNQGIEKYNSTIEGCVSDRNEVLEKLK